jgi:hypothetical protein
LISHGSRPSALVRALGLALALGAAGPAAATDLKLWPLFRYARDDVRGLVRWSAFGPLLEFWSTPETRDLRIRPFLSLHQRRGATHDDRADILYPLAASRWQDDYQSFRFLLFTYRTKAPPDVEPPPPLEQWTSRLTILPFVFYRRSPDDGARLSLFPFYLDVDDVLGYEHVRAIMFPAYLRLTEPAVERRFYPFPFVSTVGGALGRGVRVWPFYGETEVAGEQRTRYVLWPFDIESDRLVPGHGWEHRRVHFPAFAAIDGAGRETRAYGLFAYVHTLDTRHGYESTGSPWPFAVRERALGDTEYRTWRVFPVYGRSERRGIVSRFYAWPAYRTKSQDVEDFHYRRRDVGLVLWRRQRLDNEASGRTEGILTLFPLLRSTDEDGRVAGQTPALVDSLMPKNRGVLEMWAPLYGLLRWDMRPDGARDWNAVWGLVAREGGRLRGPWHLDLDAPEGPHGG